MAGVTVNGLVTKSLTEIKAEVVARLQATINASLDVSDETFVGQLVTIFSDQLDETYQAIQQVYDAAYRPTSQGTSLDGIGALTSTLRLGAVASTAKVVAVGSNATALSTGRAVSVASAQSARFQTSQAYTIVTLAARAISTVYVVGNLRSNGGNIYYAKIAGTSGVGGGPTTTASSIVDGGVTWAYIAAGSAAVLMDVVASATGPTVASVGTLTVIETPVSGWTSVTNPLAAITGRNLETDEAYRTRQAASLTIAGAGTPDAIRADLLNVLGVTAAIVFENVGDVIDVNGLPPHSLEALVLGGVDQDVANRLWTTKPAGIYTHGTIVSSVNDASLNVQTVRFSRPTNVPFYVTVTVTTDGTFPTDGATQIKDALAAFWATKLIGDDVIRSQLFSPIDAISGTVDITNIQLGLSAAPVGTSNLVITSRQLATLSAANIVVNVS